MNIVNELFGKDVVLPNGETKKCNVVAQLEHADGTVDYISGANIITSDGDEYYATASAGTPSWAVAGLRLGSAVAAPSKSSTDVGIFLVNTGHAIDATYPLTGDTDIDNTGAGANVVTWRVSYTTVEGEASGIAEGAICDSIASPTKALCHFLFGVSFSKTVDDVLKIFVNHSFVGV